MSDGDELVVDGPDGMTLGLVEDGRTADPDLDHVVLHRARPRRDGVRARGLGLERDGDRLTVDDRHVVLREGDGTRASARC